MRFFCVVLAHVLAAAAPPRSQDVDDFVKGWLEKQHAGRVIVSPSSPSPI